MQKLDWDRANEIADKVGNSYYIAKPSTFKQNYVNLLNSFKKYYNNTNIAYSYKTNYFPKFCSTVDESGGYAEVVSSMELELALRIGVDPKRIFFNGPFKCAEAVRKLLQMGGIVNIDAVEELDLILELVKGSNKKVKVGLRCNFDIDDGSRSRFGFDAYNQNTMAAVLKIIEAENIDLVALHCHFASRSLSSWMLRTREMLIFYAKLPKYVSKQIKHVSLGGGMYSEMPLCLQSQLAETIPTFDDYASVSAKEFAIFFKKNSLAPVELIIEPGTAVVANALDYLVQVNSTKIIDDQVFITVNGSSFNMGTHKSNINLPYTILNQTPKSNNLKIKNAKIVGYTCIEGDILHNYFSGSIARNDFILFHEVGSYSIVMKPPFILPNVAIIELTNDIAGFHMSKRPESFMDIFHTYKM